MSLRNIIEEINAEVGKSFVKIPGIALYGISELFYRKDQDDKVSTIPGISDTTGKITYVGYDDKAPLIIYHRLFSASQSEKPLSSYGDNRTDQITTYNNLLFVYADRKTICVDSADLLEIIQVAMPEALSIQNYKNVITRITNINFNTQQILRSEYLGQSIRIRPERVMMQINYQIETTLRKICAPRCP